MRRIHGIHMDEMPADRRLIQLPLFFCENLRELLGEMPEPDEFVLIL